MRTVVNSVKNTTTVNPVLGKHSATVLIMHGLGDTADGFTPVAEMLSGVLDHVKFVLPTAPTQPVTLNMGMPMPSWYDIVGLDDRASESCKGLPESRHRIESLIEEEVAAGLKYERIILAGFSQGGALSLYTGLQLPAEKKPAGVVVMSGYLPAASTFTVTPGLEDTPVLHCHGQDDAVVRFDWATKTRDAVIEKGAVNYEFKPYPGLPHSVDERVIRDVMSFIQRTVPHDTEHLVPLPNPSDMSVKELKAAIKAAGLSAQANGFAEKGEFVQLLQGHYDSLR